MDRFRRATKGWLHGPAWLTKRPRPVSLRRWRGKLSAWVVTGFAGGLAVWLAALLTLGNPRISPYVPILEGQSSPILVSRVSFRTVADLSGTATPEAQAAAPELAVPSTTASESPKPHPATAPLLEVMKMPEVAAALKTTFDLSALFPQQVPSGSSPQGSPSTTVSPPGTLTPQGPGLVATSEIPEGAHTLDPTASTREPSGVPKFGQPENMAPGQPVANLTQVVNPTKKPLVSRIRPIIEHDSGLCSRVQTAVVAMENREGAKMLAGGLLTDVVNGDPIQMVLEPQKRYHLAMLISLPPDLPNEYHGVSCVVGFCLDVQEV